MDKYTIQQFKKLFPDDDVCLEWLRNKLYPQKIYCTKCLKLTKFYRIKDRKVYGCDLCGHQISPTANTIFDHSPTPLRLWFYAIYLMSTTRCGISAKQLQRELGVTYKTAWRMFHQVRSMLNDGIFPLSGELEVDEIYIGGRRSSKRGRRVSGKTSVETTTLPIVKEHVLPKTMMDKIRSQQC